MGGSGPSKRSLLSSKQKWDYGPSDFVVTHNVLLSGLYDLPIFKTDMTRRESLWRVECERDLPIPHRFRGRRWRATIARAHPPEACAQLSYLLPGRGKK